MLIGGDLLFNFKLMILCVNLSVYFLSVLSVLTRDGIEGEMHRLKSWRPSYLPNHSVTDSAAHVEQAVQGLTKAGG